MLGLHKLPVRNVQSDCNHVFFLLCEYLTTAAITAYAVTQHVLKKEIGVSGASVLGDVLGVNQSLKTLM